MDELAELSIAECKEKMAKVITHAKSEFSILRTGRANPSVVEKLRVSYYGSETPLRQLASFTVPEARLLVITPYDKGSIAAIEKAIQNSDLGINPSSDGQVIRLAFPPLTQERRKEMVKLAKTKAEEARIGIRNIRRSTRHDLEELELPSDDLERVEKELDKTTQDFVAEVDRLFHQKEQELLEI